MNISLGEAFESYVRAQTDSGRYGTASEVIREALRLKMRADEEHAAKLEALRADIAFAREQVRRGDVVETDAEGFLDRTRRHG